MPVSESGISSLAACMFHPVSVSVGGFLTPNDTEVMCKYCTLLRMFYVALLAHKPIVQLYQGLAVGLAVLCLMLLVLLSVHASLTSAAS
jgi:hypothetical protein